MEHPHGGNNAEPPGLLEVGQGSQIRRIPTNPALRKPDNTFAVDDREKAECLADGIEQQCSNNTIHDATHSHRIEEEVRTKIALEPQDDLAPSP
ncbi:hypothetical protein EVAR_23938_1 [Eumeta japonica]|uniref:Uncharacterized protein n=1 Tax=Eumeta variegata TaxID=151549 RepID=A0A4C1V2L2_EUMVA|nr:hypothetical protein EVAR_23938_1 [Eumeta japonica]